MNGYRTTSPFAMIVAPGRIGSLLLAVASVGCSGGWENDAPAPPDFVTLRELNADSQPGPGALGVLVAVAAQGGSAVLLSESQGTIDDIDASTSCVSLVDGGLQAFVVAIHPTSSEAVVTASLGDLEDGGASAETCSGVPFRPLGPTATLVASLGRAPASPSASVEAGGGAAPTADGGPTADGPAEGTLFDAPASDTAPDDAMPSTGDAAKGDGP